MITNRALQAGWIFLALSSSPARGSAALFSPDGQTAVPEATEISIVVDDGTIEVIHILEYTGNAESIGWVIPILGAINTAEEANTVSIGDLEEATQPVVSMESDEKADGCSCERGEQSSLLLNAAYGIPLDGDTFVGSYDITSFQRGEVDKLEAWLESNEWTFDEAWSDLFDDYAEQNYNFVAIKHEPNEPETPPLGRQLVPMMIRYSSQYVTTAMQTVSLTDAETFRSTIWVQTDRRIYPMGGWTYEELEVLEAGDLSEVDDVFEEALWAVGGDQAVFAATWADEYDESTGVWVTRLDAWANADAHAADPDFSTAAGTPAVSTEITTTARSLGASALLFLPCALVIARRRKSSGQRPPDGGR